MNQLEASTALHEWQRLRGMGFSPDERIERLMADFFAPPQPCDVEYAAIERTLMEIMSYVEA